MIKKTAILAAGLFVSALLHAADQPAPNAKPSGKPNVIYILADDLGYGDLSCYGQKKLQTPNIDRLAAEGMKFTDHYSGSAVCSPSRECLMTGQHPCHGTADSIVPYEDDAAPPVKMWQDNGGRLKLFPKEGADHHPHGLPDPAPIIEILVVEASKSAEPSRAATQLNPKNQTYKKVIKQ